MQEGDSEVGDERGKANNASRKSPLEKNSKVKKQGRDQ